MAFPFNLNQLSKGPVFYDIREDLPGFETIADVDKESQIRQKALIKRGLVKRGYIDLAEKLFEGGGDDYHCMSPACPRCVRINRQGFYHAATTLSNQYDEANQRLIVSVQRHHLSLSIHLL